LFQRPFGDGAEPDEDRQGGQHDQGHHQQGELSEQALFLPHEDGSVRPFIRAPGDIGIMLGIIHLY
jgi:hypothetical protein